MEHFQSRSEHQNNNLSFDQAEKLFLMRSNLLLMTVSSEERRRFTGP